MNVGLSLNWWRCPDGVEFFKWREPGSTMRFGRQDPIITKPAEHEAIRVKSAGVDVLHFESGDYKNATVFEFVKAGSNRDLLHFVAQNGFPTKTVHETLANEKRLDGGSLLEIYGERPFQTLNDIRQQQNELIALLRAGFAHDVPEDLFNSQSTLARTIRMNQVSGASLTAKMVRHTADNLPCLMLEPTTLYDYMKMEAASILCGPGELQTCPHCGGFFVMRGASAKRTDSKFCSAKCRLAAWRVAKKIKGELDVRS